MPARGGPRAPRILDPSDARCLSRCARGPTAARATRPGTTDHVQTIPRLRLEQVENAAAASSLNRERPHEHWRMAAMSQIKRFDHVGVTVADLDTVTAFFVG